MKRVLIISPNFPPINAADMHRVRQSLPYFSELGWEPVILTVDEKYIEVYSTDPLLLHTVPADIEIHKVAAWDVARTRKFGLGALGLRSYTHLKRKGSELLKKRHFDLVYFSTTAFHVMALGPYWNKRFGVPFILDIQDPWRNDFYLDKPASERPPKFFIAYNIDKYLEARTVPRAAGIISVSQGYCDTFIQRYPSIRSQQCRVIPFGAVPRDMDIMRQYVHRSSVVTFSPDKINIVYIGRGGHDMRFALDIVFTAYLKGLQTDPALFSRIHFWFIGTSYAPAGTGRQTILPVARDHGMQGNVTEIPDRIPYFDTLYLLQQADILLVPGSTDVNYTASKIYPYILARKPLLAIFHRKSSVLKVLEDTQYGSTIIFDDPKDGAAKYAADCLSRLKGLLAQRGQDIAFNVHAFEQYTAEAMTKKQVDFFNQVLTIPTHAHN
jgi:hypothetical protein